MTTQQIKFAHVLLKQTGLIAVKDELCWDYSGKKSCKLSELDADAARALIKYLKEKAQQPDDPAEKMRKKILSMAHEMRWELPAPMPGAKKPVDMEWVNNWCVKYGFGHKRLNNYTYEELPRLVTAFEKVYKGFLMNI